MHSHMYLQYRMYRVGYCVTTHYLLVSHDSVECVVACIKVDMVGMVVYTTKPSPSRLQITETR